MILKTPELELHQHAELKPRQTRMERILCRTVPVRIEILSQNIAEAWTTRTCQLEWFFMPSILFRTGRPAHRFRRKDAWTRRPLSGWFPDWSDYHQCAQPSVDWRDCPPTPPFSMVSHWARASHGQRPVSPKDSFRWDSEPLGQILYSSPFLLKDVLLLIPAVMHKILRFQCFYCPSFGKIWIYRRQYLTCFIFNFLWFIRQFILNNVSVKRALRLHIYK